MNITFEKLSITFSLSTGSIMHNLHHMCVIKTILYSKIYQFSCIIDSWCIFSYFLIRVNLWFGTENLETILGIYWFHRNQYTGSTMYNLHHMCVIKAILYGKIYQFSCMSTLGVLFPIFLFMFIFGLVQLSQHTPKKLDV